MFLNIMLNFGFRYGGGLRDETFGSPVISVGKNAYFGGHPNILKGVWVLHQKSSPLPGASRSRRKIHI